MSEQTVIDLGASGPAVISAVDELSGRAAEIVIAEQKASVSLLQRRLGIGYNRAARLMDALEAAGAVTSADHVGQREVVAQEVPGDLRADLVLRAREASGKPLMKETPEDRDVSGRAYGVAAGELRSFVERYEKLEAEKKEIADQMKEVMAEAKGRGYDVKVLRKVIALRKRDKDDIAEEEAVLEMYKAALGME